MMSPQVALHDPIFRAYFWIVLISLAIGGAALGFLRVVLKKDTGSMFKTYWSWIFMAGIGLIVVFLGRIPTIVGVTLLAIYAFKEFARASGLYRDWWMTGAVYAGIITVGISSLISHPRGEEPRAGWYGLFVAVPVFAIALILFIPILRNRARGELQRMSLAIVGFIYIGWIFRLLGFLANATNASGFFFYIFFPSELCNVPAFISARTFSTHPHQCALITH